MSSALPTLNPKKFYFLRHGQTQANIDQKINGYTDDPLTDLGLAQAQHAGEVLAALFMKTPQNPPFEQIFASPLQRAKITAEIVQKEIFSQTGRLLPLTLDKNLMEANFGLSEKSPKGPWYENWLDGLHHIAEGETFEALQARAVKIVNKITAQKNNSLIVAHGTFFRALRFCMGLSHKVQTPNAAPLLALPPENEDLMEWKLLFLE